VLFIDLCVVVHKFFYFHIGVEVTKQVLLLQTRIDTENNSLQLRFR
jgi:hypothetical protein